MKVLKLEDFKEDYMEVFLKKELFIVEKTHHPNIVRIFEIFNDEKNFYVVQEIMRGGEMEDNLYSLRLDKNNKLKEKFEEAHCIAIVE